MNNFPWKPKTRQLFMLRLESVQECKWEGSLSVWWQMIYMQIFSVLFHTEGCYELSRKLSQSHCLSVHNLFNLLLCVWLINAKLVWFIALLCVVLFNGKCFFVIVMHALWFSTTLTFEWLWGRIKWRNCN